MNEELKIRDAIRCCLRNNVPFVSYMFPGSEQIHFFSNPSFSSDTSDFSNRRSFSIGTWNGRTKDNIVITDELNADGILEYYNTNGKIHQAPAVLPYSVSTSREEYLQKVSILVDRLKRRGGKTVWSRIRCGNLNDGVSNDNEERWLSIAHEYFSVNPDTFRFIFFTPLTGSWIGASPERLLSVDFTDRSFSTMSLAGTRRLNKDLPDEPWDEKNLYEHELVTRFILSTLADLGIKANCGPLITRNLPGLQHLCNEISGYLYNQSPTEVIDRLNPTPALAGFPVKEALRELTQLETHERRCYGGCLMIEDGNRLDAFVNLRSLHFYGNSYCIYAGGGITPESIPANEWEETEIKMHTLTEIINRN